MKNSLGNPARGEAFFKREKEVRKIYKVLETGTSIYLSAPRRVGKTSILKHLEERPAEGYHFIYIITESIDSQNDFFKRIFEELIASDAIKKLTKLSNAIKEALIVLKGQIKNINGIELREGEESDYFNLLLDLFANLNKEHGRVVLMIDEFPQTIQNILDKEGKEIAEIFIQKNRELRHHKNVQSNVSLIYTGSISLFPMVEKVTALTSINDLRTVDVDPLEVNDAKYFLSLLMQNDNIIITDHLLDYVINKIGWLIPFHLQLIQQEIVDVFDSTGNDISEGSIDRAFEQIVHTRNKPQFEPYFSRLNGIFKGEEYVFAMELLKLIAQLNSVKYDQLYDLSVKYKIKDLKYLMDLLEGDGYLFKKENEYFYTSPILQLWCKKHICQ